MRNILPLTLPKAGSSLKENKLSDEAWAPLKTNWTERWPTIWFNMAARVLLRDQPHRAIALTTSSHVLIFRHSSTSRAGSASTTSLHIQAAGSGIAGETGGPRCIVELAEVEKVDLSGYKPISLSVHGTLGLITVEDDVFLCVVSGTSRAAQRRPEETVNRILSVDFCKLHL